jgi:hypothetical protein
MSDYEQVKIDPSQFTILERRFNALGAELQIIRERLGPVDKNKSIQKTLEEGFASLKTEITKWQGIQNNSIIAGFALVAEALTKSTLPPPQPNPLEVTFVFKVANDHQDEPFSIAIGGVTDAEGEPLPDTSGLTVEVTSSDDTVVSANFDPATNSGVAHFGTSGVASLNASVKNAKGDILGSGAADFTVTTGDPAAISDVRISFGGLTEEPPAEG